MRALLVLAAFAALTACDRPATVDHEAAMKAEVAADAVDVVDRRAQTAFETAARANKTAQENDARLDALESRVKELEWDRMNRDGSRPRYQGEPQLQLEPGR